MAIHREEKISKAATKAVAMAKEIIIQLGGNPMLSKMQSDDSGLADVNTSLPKIMALDVN